MGCANGRRCDTRRGVACLSRKVLPDDRHRSAALQPISDQPRFRGARRRRMTGHRSSQVVWRLSMRHVLRQCSAISGLSSNERCRSAVSPVVRSIPTKHGDPGQRSKVPAVPHMSKGEQVPEQVRRSAPANGRAVCRSGCRPTSPRSHLGQRGGAFPLLLIDVQSSCTPGAASSAKNRALGTREGVSPVRSCR